MNINLLNKIGYYQFDNLINNRVPFLFLNLAQDVSTWYNSIYKMHVETNQIMIQNSDEIINVLNQRQIPKEFAILLLCNTGQQSESLARQLEIKGYTNVYLIDGGYQQMIKDKG